MLEPRWLESDVLEAVRVEVSGVLRAPGLVRPHLAARFIDPRQLVTSPVRLPEQRRRAKGVALIGDISCIRACPSTRSRTRARPTVAMRTLAHQQSAGALGSPRAPTISFVGVCRRDHTSHNNRVWPHAAPPLPLFWSSLRPPPWCGRLSSTYRCYSHDCTRMPLRTSCLVV